MTVRSRAFQDPLEEWYFTSKNLLVDHAGEMAEMAERVKARDWLAMPAYVPEWNEGVDSLRGFGWRSIPVCGRDLYGMRLEQEVPELELLEDDLMPIDAAAARRMAKLRTESPARSAFIRDLEARTRTGNPIDMAAWLTPISAEYGRLRRRELDCMIDIESLLWGMGVMHVIKGLIFLDKFAMLVTKGMMSDITSVSGGIDPIGATLTLRRRDLLKVRTEMRTSKTAYLHQLVAANHRYADPEDPWWRAVVRSTEF